MSTNNKTLKRVVKRVMLFPNGNLVVFDKDGEQLNEMQGAFSIDKLKRIMLERVFDCEFSGFHIIPNSWLDDCKKWAEYFRDINMTYQQITE